MASPVGYQTFCPVGAALNVVGERWALLVVRDLFLGPRRYTELLTGLGGIGTDILAARLRTLQEHGLVRQVGKGRAQRYELTDSGRELRPVLAALGRWGADRVRLPADPAQIPPRVPLTSLLVGATALPRQANGAYAIRVEQEEVRVDVAGGQVHPAPDSEPGTTIELTRSGLGHSSSALPPPNSSKTGTSRSKATVDEPMPCSTRCPGRRGSPGCADNSRLASERLRNLATAMPASSSSSWASSRARGGHSPRARSRPRDAAPSWPSSEASSSVGRSSQALFDVKRPNLLAAQARDGRPVRARVGERSCYNRARLTAL